MAVTSPESIPHHGNRPVPAIRKMESKHGLKLADFDLIELNEPSPRRCWPAAATAIFDRTSSRQRRRDRARPPIVATGARITVTLLHEMLKRKSKRGLATSEKWRHGMALANRKCRPGWPT